VYDFLEGRLASRSPARVVLEVHGVGYDLAVPLSAKFPESLPANATLRVWTHQVVREDAHLLFGFPDAATRDLFRALLTVRGVGPSVAIAILSGMDRRELLAAVLAGDVRRLTSVRGVGKKTAEQILLDLRDKAARLAAETAAGGKAAVLTPDALAQRQLDDGIAALVGIGYSEKEALRQVERAAKEVDPANLELLVRTALQG
jgi:holliday junction DNA helicase RuvA